MPEPSPTPPPVNPYAVLRVPRTATPAEITHAYRQLLREHHPDTRTLTDQLHAQGTEQAAEQADDHDAILRQVLAAYAILREPARRADYDQHHPPEPNPSTPRPATRATKPRRYAPPGEPPLKAGPPIWIRPRRSP